MTNLFKELSKNNKVAQIKTSTIPSLEDEVQYNEIKAILSTNRNLYDWAKQLTIKPAIDDLYDVEIYMAQNPNETIIKDLYNEYKTKDWEAVRYAHEYSYINLRVDGTIISKLINWLHSKIN